MPIITRRVNDLTALVMRCLAKIKELYTRVEVLEEDVYKHKHKPHHDKEENE